MALETIDALTELLPDLIQNERIHTWLWFYLEKEKLQLNWNYFNHKFMRNEMADAIRKHRYLINKIIDHYDYHLLPEEFFDWITDSERLCRWSIRYICKAHRDSAYTPPSDRIGRDIVIAMIDTLEVSKTRKESFVIQMKTDWISLSNEDKPFLWFKDKDEYQKCELVYKWIKKNGYSTRRLPTESINNHEEMMVHFDDMNFRKEEKLLCLSDIKKSWSQQQYRKNLKGKKQCNFILSEKAVKRLDGLAKMHELKRAEVLEILLKMETEKQNYITERMRILNALKE